MADVSITISREKVVMALERLRDAFDTWMVIFIAADVISALTGALNPYPPATEVWWA